ncbi:MAG: DUF6443 domain-containing protein [Bacteroidota bacterium]
MKKLLCLLAFLMLGLSAYAQENNLFNPINNTAKIPQSPEVAAFEKFSGSVNMYNGVPTIGIPIYTLAGKELSVPISLSYDASGIKVDQIATNIGLGWNLNYGGVVTRNVHGRPDDYIYTGGHPVHTIDDFNTETWLTYLMDQGNIHGIHLNNTGATKAKNFYKEYQDHNVDHQPDTFSFNVNGLSGTIVIDYYDPLGPKAYCLDNPAVKIESTHPFVIVDPNGTRYTFAKEEHTEHWTSPNSTGTIDPTDEYAQKYITAWYLTKIESVNGLDIFELEYDTDEWLDEEIPMELQQVELKEQSCGFGNWEARGILNLGMDRYIKHQVYLTEISYNGDIVLKTSSDLNRSDLNGVHRITGLEIYDRVSPVISANRLLRVDFDNPSYFGDINGTASKKRLKLDGLSIYRNDATDAKEYLFDYENAAGVPDRDSYGMDLWGYYNGMDGNNHLAPDPNDDYSDFAKYQPDIDSFDPFTQAVPTADRRYDFDKTKIGTLTSITYPTGGKSTYTYEPHYDDDQKIVGGLRLYSVKNETNDPVSGENDILETFYYYNDLKVKVDGGMSIPSSSIASTDTTPYASSGITQQELNFNEKKILDDDNTNCNTKFYLLTLNRAVEVPMDITYSSVTELRFNKALSGSQFEGATVTHFYNDEYDLAFGRADSQRPFFNEKLEYGSIKYQRVYDNQMDLLQETYNEYVTDTVAGSTLPDKVGLIVYQSKWENNAPVAFATGGSSGCWSIDGPHSGGTYSFTNYFSPVVGAQIFCNSGDTAHDGPYSHYDHTPGYGYGHIWLKMISSKTTVYESTQQQEVITTYAYNGNDHYFPTQTVTTDSKGGYIKSNTLYPSDHVSLINYPNLSVLQDMAARNQLSTPVQVTSHYDEDGDGSGGYVEMSQQRSIFDDFTPSGQSNGFSLLQPSKVQVSKGSESLEDRILFHSYDAYGNLTEVSYPPVSAMRHMYLWGYKGDHLLAEIKNASFATISSATQTTLDNIIADSHVENTQTEEDDLRDDLNDLRILTDFEDAQLSVYTYDPGIGVKSITDIRDYTNFYYYDQHNRLDYTTDENNRVLGKNEYVFRVNQFTGENYIKTTSYQKEFVISQINADTPLDNDKIESISFSDGMGRVKQSIALRAGGNRENIVQYIEYDDLGRDARQYLPYASTTSGSNYIPLATAKLGVEDFYDVSKYGNTTNPYSENNFEKSPRSRVLETGAPGSSWEVNFNSDTDHTVKTEYSFNNGAEVRKFYVSYSSQGATPQLEYDNDYYLSEELSKVTLKDENWQPSDGLNNLTQTFTNKNGQLLLKRQRVYDPNRTTDQTYRINTYYIYDDFGNLVFVLSPKASDEIVNTGGLVSNYQEILDLYAYQYKYDDRNRLIWKKIPGRGYEEIYYDLLDRPVLTQDANLRADNQFLFTKYDAFDRVVYTGIYSPTPPASPSRTELENSINAGDLYETRTTTATNMDGTNVYYTKGAFPSSNMEVLTVSYYDSYVDTGNVGLPPSVTSYGTAITDDTDGLPTVSKVKVLHDNTTEDWITTVTGYDVKGRPIYIKSENPYLEKTDLLESKLDFVGKALETTTIHYDDAGNNPDITIVDYFNYDHVGRLLTQEQQIDDSPVQLIAKNVYDNMGQLVQKNVGGETFVDGYTSIQNVDVSGDIIVEKVGTSSSYDAGLLTRGKFKDEGGVQFKVLTPDKELRVGFHTGSAAQIEPYETLHYGVICTGETGTGTGNYKLKYIDGSTIAYASVDYKLNDVITVERIDVGSGVYNIEYSINAGTPFYTATVNISTAPLLGKAVFYDPNGKIEDFELVGNNIDKILQNIDYKYNVRGWMTDINNVDGPASPGDTDIFSFRINYDQQVAGTASTPSLYNGNISQTVWLTINDNVKRGYSYEYDQVDRLIGATGRKGYNLDTATDFNLDAVTYDVNGNIETLKRFGDDPNSSLPLVWDELTYAYSGNQLNAVADVGASDQGYLGDSSLNTSYYYDVNGNMTSDANKGITSITYNHLDLPEVISIYNGTITNTITYVYDATGVKLSKSIIDEGNTMTLYAGGFVYSGQGVATDLQFISQPEGYIVPVSSQGGVSGFDKGSNTTIFSSYDYVFQFTDHLGNVRLSYSDVLKDGVINPSTDIVEESNYYPFGLKHLGYNYTVSSNGNALAQQWKFGGKQIQEELGLQWYDVSARNFDPALGRWMNIDPLAEQMRRHSPYNFGFNNPIYFQDYDGMAPQAPDTVIVTGSQAEATTASLNESTSLEITRDSDGILSAAGEAITEYDQALLDAINSESITVSLATTDQVFTRSPFGGDIGTIEVGSFLGSTGEDGSVDAVNAFNLDHAKIDEDSGGTSAGSSAGHEIIEAFEGGKENRGLIPGGSETIIPGTARGDSVYLRAHEKANSLDGANSIDTSAEFNSETGDMHLVQPNGTRVLLYNYNHELRKLRDAERDH